MSYKLPNQLLEKVTMQYDHIISIGGNCDVAYHIRRHYGLETSFPMDWLILSFEGAISLFDDQFRDFIVLNRLSLWNGTRHAFQCSQREIIYQHDFSRDHQALVKVENLVSDFNLAKIKYRRRIKRLKDLCCAKRSILFVRSWREILHTPPDYPEYCIRGVPKYAFLRLLNSIECCFPDISFQVLFINYGDQELDDPRAIFENVRNMGDVTNWAGSPAGWDAILNNYNIIMS